MSLFGMKLRCGMLELQLEQGSPCSTVYRLHSM